MDENCVQEERIGNLEQMIAEVSQRQTDMIQKLEIHLVQSQAAMEKIEAHERTLRGSNGDVGLIAKVSQSTEILEDLRSALRGTRESSGLIAEINSLSKVIRELQDDRKWLFRLVAGWIVTAIVSAVFIITK